MFLLDVKAYRAQVLARDNLAQVRFACTFACELMSCI